MWWCVLRAIPDPDYDLYRLVLIDPRSRCVFAEQINLRWALPRVEIPRWTRPAERLVSEIRDKFGIQSIVLDELKASSLGSLMLAEVIQHLTPVTKGSFSWKPLSDVPDDEFLETERGLVQNLLLHGATGRGQFSRLGWLSEALAWIARHTGLSPNQLVDIKQINASSSSSLIRIQSETGPVYWFKAIADEEMGEYRVTVALRELFSDYLPTLLATHDAWRAWLMEDAGRPLDEMDNVRPRLFESVAHHLAELQKASVAAVPILLDQGFSDHRIPSLRATMPEIMTYLEEAVEMPDFGKHGYLRRRRIRELHQSFQEAAARLEDSDIPDTLIHSDINTGNILIADGTCIFSDWALAGVGNPFANFEQLRIQVAQDYSAPAFHDRLYAAYRRTWSTHLSPVQIHQAFSVVQPVAIAMYLHNRRNWFTSELLREPQFVRYARSMARQMDRAVREIQTREAITARIRLDRRLFN